MSKIMPNISIVVIGYNVEVTIKECIESCCNQGYEKLQVVFVDDGSTDKTPEILQELVTKYDNLLYNRQNNQGANAARKKGFDLATGEYVLFVDGDDCLVENALCHLVDIVNDKIEQLDFLEFEYVTFNECGVKEEAHLKYVEDLKGLDFLKYVIRHDNPHYLWNKMYRREFLEKLPFAEIPSITMGDDLAACIRMGIKEPHVFIIRDALYKYRVSENSVSRKPNERYLELLKMMDDIECQLRESNLYEEFKEEIDYNYFLLFFYYVVKNKYSHGHIQEAIYLEWLSKKIKLKDNCYIQAKLHEINPLARGLVLITDKKFGVGRFLSRVYGVITNHK